MADQELSSLKRAEKRNRIIFGSIIAACLVGLTGLLLVMSPGNQLDRYTLGGECSGHCGRFAFDDWVCVNILDTPAYCSRPCGETYGGCPEGLECRRLGPSMSLPEGVASDAPGYCLKDGPAVGMLVKPRLDLDTMGDSAAGLIFEPLTIEVGASAEASGQE